MIKWNCQIAVSFCCASFVPISMHFGTLGVCMLIDISLASDIMKYSFGTVLVSSFPL